MRLYKYKIYKDFENIQYVLILWRTFNNYYLTLPMNWDTYIWVIWNSHLKNKLLKYVYKKVMFKNNFLDKSLKQSNS